MPTNPNQPNSNAAIDRLALGVDSPRGTEPSFPFPSCACNCFDAEASSLGMMCICFETETSGVIPCSPLCGCFESE